MKVPNLVFSLLITIAVALIHENLVGNYALYGDAVVAMLLALGKVIEVNQPVSTDMSRIDAPRNKVKEFLVG